MNHIETCPLLSAKTLRKTSLAFAYCLSALCITGCSQQETSEAQITAETANAQAGSGSHIEAPVAPSANGEQYILAAEPSEYQDVIAARESAKTDDEVVLFGQIGGSVDPWIEGRAMFTIVDDSLKSCDETGDGCTKPWDYCCETPKLKTAMALVKVVDDQGEPVKTDARELLGVRELTSVIVQGKAQRDDAGNLTVLATGIYVKK